MNARCMRRDTERKDSKHLLLLLLLTAVGTAASYHDRSSSTNVGRKYVGLLRLFLACLRSNKKTFDVDLICTVDYDITRIRIELVVAQIISLPLAI